MSRWASQIGLSLAAGVAILGLAAIGVYLLLAGIVFAGTAIVLGLGLYLIWTSWRSRSDHAWR